MNKILLTIGLVFISLSLIAQQKLIPEIQFGIATPTGDFAEDDKYTAIFGGSGYAKDGIYLGIKTLKTLSTEGLSWTLGLGLTSNKLSKDYIDFSNETVYENMEEKVGPLYEFSISYPSYTNIPLITGLQYEKTIAQQLCLFGEFGVGFNMLQIGKLDMRVNGDRVRYIFDPSLTTAYKLGAGVTINQKYTINLTYMLMGTHKVYYTIVNSIESVDDALEKSLPVSTLNLSLGMRIK